MTDTMKQEYGLLLREIKQQIDPYTKILVGFSGGVDSTVLLQGLYVYVMNSNYL